ncbi:Fic family protein [Variovorax sp. PCZ-1]|uniref:Fic/DOC family protein n=1 Tax=Variovorax sp. PCZ-1 TaxID=2835533 RepID=UPI001BD1B5AD|nr:Fic family protein [Variovorax sp. PCZ-1]MBS7806952.1 Fic family protein [Variovorax sp. PCZ-1]
MAANRYQATGIEAEFELGSRGRVLRNLLGIVRVRDMNLAESQALEIAQDLALDRFDADHRFTAQDVCDLHTLWLGPIYPWAGEYRSVDIGKGGFQFAHARLIPGLMAQIEQGALRIHTPCRVGDDSALALALAEVHAELILVHPFREGNGRLARLLALLMALQAGLPPLDFSPMLGRGRRIYIGGIHAAMGRDYLPLAAVFEKIIVRSKRRAAANMR